MLLASCALQRPHSTSSSTEKTSDSQNENRDEAEPDELSNFFSEAMKKKNLSSQEEQKAEDCLKDFYVRARFIDAKLVDQNNTRKETYFRRYEWGGEKAVLVDKNHWNSLSKEKQAAALLEFCLQ